MAADKTIGRNTNKSDTATTGEVSVNSNTAQTLVPANPERISLTVSNPSNQELWIRFYPASDNNDKVGIFLENNRAGHWTMLTDNIYTGEVSVIMDSGGTKQIQFTEY